TLERQSREGRSTGRGGSLTTRISPRICGTSNEKQQHCPSRWLSAVISRRLSGAAIGGNKNGRYECNCGATQRADRSRGCWIGEATGRKVGRECSGSRGDGGGAGRWRWRRSSRCGRRRENHFRRYPEGKGRAQDPRDQRSTRP